MDILSATLIILGLVLFETINSVDNAVINAEVIGKMGERARRWFLTWGILIAVFLVRGLLPLIIVWMAVPDIGLWQAFSATLSGDEAALAAVDRSAPILLLGAGIFLVFLFLHWLFLEPKTFGLRAEKFFFENGLWFFATASIMLAAVVWFAIHKDPMLAFGAVVGSSAFFIVNGFRENAEQAERRLQRAGSSDTSKLLYLQMIDAAFSIDGVLGAFAFTLSVPLILIGNGIGAYLVRALTISNIERVKRYVFLKHGAMYSLLFLGSVMLAHGFGIHVPEYTSPLITFAVIGYFFFKSKKLLTIRVEAIS